jgi:RNA polymerase sigma-70 factor (ECF subfamily)
MAFDEDSRLARKVQKGDRQAFEVLLARYERPIFSFIFHFFRERPLCEDLTQETFLRAFRFIGSFRPKEKFSSWLYSIAKNLCIDEIRRRQKGTTVDIDAVEPDDLVADSPAGNNPLVASVMVQQGEILRKAIARLPEKYRTSILLFYFNELSYEEISEVMGISLSNTKILLFRGKKMLQEIYREETGGKV